MQKATRSSPVGLSEETKPQIQSFLSPYLANVLDQSVLGIVWLQGLNAVGKKGGKCDQKKLEVLECFLVAARRKGQIVSFPTLLPGHQLFFCQQSDVPRFQLQITPLSMCWRQEAEFVQSWIIAIFLWQWLQFLCSLFVCFLHQPLVSTGRNKGERLFTKFRNSVLETVSVLQEATVVCSESRLIFFNMNAAAVSCFMNFGLLKNNSRHVSIFLSYSIPFYLFLKEKNIVRI